MKTVELAALVKSRIGEVLAKVEYYVSWDELWNLEFSMF